MDIPGRAANYAKWSWFNTEPLALTDGNFATFIKYPPLWALKIRNPLPIKQLISGNRTFTDLSDLLCEEAVYWIYNKMTNVTVAFSGRLLHNICISIATLAKIQNCQFRIFTGSNGDYLCTVLRLTAVLNSIVTSQLSAAKSAIRLTVCQKRLRHHSHARRRWAPNTPSHSAPLGGSSIWVSHRNDSYSAHTARPRLGGL